MQNIIQQTIEIISTGFEKNIKNLLETGQDISQFILETQKDLNSVGVALVKEALEKADERVKSGKERKKDWYVKEKAAQNTLATIFGEVHYIRTYYVHKKTTEYKYLSDEMLGISTYDKMDLSLKAKLVEEAIETPYRRSGKKATEALELSGQSVMNTIRELGAIANHEADYKPVNKESTILYVEADEDHVSLQNRGIAEPKLVYVHEGFKLKGNNRWELVNPRYFGGMYSKSDDLWEEVSDYINEVYDYEKLKKVYVSGDGAKYIKNGAKWLNKGIYVFDRYHLMKYIKQAARHIENGEREIWKALKEQDKKYLKIVFDTIEGATPEGTRLESVKEAAKCIMNNFESIKYHYFNDYGGCSAEGHISHIYADRMSSRPLGWSIQGVDQMARLRVFKKNGGNIYALMLKKKNELKKEQFLDLQNKNILKLRKKVACGETLGNIEILNIGKCSRLQKTLKSLR
jgi:hypothetical protein